MTDYKLTKLISINWKYEKYSYNYLFNKKKSNEYHLDFFENENLLEKPTYIYKFFGNNNNSYNSLKEKYFYLSNPKCFNDPFDCLSNRDKFINKISEEAKQLRENIGVCCFSRIKDNRLMWGHYTNSYNGFCIKIKNSNLYLNNQKLLQNHISYLNKYNIRNENLQKVFNDVDKLDFFNKTDKQHIKNFMLMNFEYFWKSSDWLYEKEYRVVSIFSKNNERKLNFNKNNIEEIYIGYNLKNNTTDYNILLKILDDIYPNIKIFIVEPDPMSLKLNFKKMN